MLAERVVDELGRLHRPQRVGQRLRQLLDAELGEHLVVDLEQVGVGLGRQLVALGDAAHARPPASALKARYGLHAGSGERYSMRVASGLPRLAIGTRISPLRLLRAHDTWTGASKPGTSRL